MRAGGADFPLRLTGGSVELEVRSRAFQRAWPTKAAGEVAAALGAVAFRRDLPTEVAQTPLRHLIVAVQDTAALGKLTVDARQIASLAAHAEVDTVCVWSPTADRRRFGVRDLCAGISALEKAASGTTAAALGLYLARHGLLDGPELVIEQGVEMGRASRIEVIVDPPDRATIRGMARRVSTGTLDLPDSSEISAGRGPQTATALTDDMKRVVLEQRLGYAATVCPDGTPNLSPKGTVTVWDDHHLAFADICSPNTIRNLRANPWIELNVVDPIVRKGYRFKGRAELHHAGDLYARGLRLLTERGMDATPERINTVVLVRVEQAAPLISPAYDSGASEQHVAAKWEAHRSELARHRADREPRPGPP